ncbi:MAG: hypothetical protein K1X67_14010 [Fimbriimonadaceae bacterium]|nr:hypothetical protein [Fimbriimonadaceae bacterium]
MIHRFTRKHNHHTRPAPGQPGTLAEQIVKVNTPIRLDPDYLRAVEVVRALRLAIRYRPDDMAEIVHALAGDCSHE